MWLRRWPSVVRFEPQSDFTGYAWSTRSLRHSQVLSARSQRPIDADVQNEIAGVQNPVASLTACARQAAVVHEDNSSPWESLISCGAQCWRGFPEQRTARGSDEAASLGRACKQLVGVTSAHKARYPTTGAPMNRALPEPQGVSHGNPS
jgi:hypothetical protein